MAWVEMHWGSRTALFFCREVPAPPKKKNWVLINTSLCLPVL
jgi:hypothetical protein